MRFLVRLSGLVFAGLIPALPAAAQASRADAPDLDSAIARAGRALDQDLPWQATRLLAPLTRVYDDDPVLLLTAARAAARWRGWTTVTRHLADQPWLDQYRGGEGRALLGRAFLERGQAERAVIETGRALRDAPAGSLPDRLTFHARALDRLGRFDSAAAVYRRAAEANPDLAEWFLLRAAGVEADSAARDRIYRRIEAAPVRARIGWTEALALDRTEQWTAAARAYADLGARLASLRIRLEHGDTADRRVARRELIGALGSTLPSDEVADAIGLFDRHFPKRLPAEELVIARRGASVAPERAVRGFTAARRLLTDRDRLGYAGALARVGRIADAGAQLAAVRTPSLRADAAYQRARLFVRSGRAGVTQGSLRSIAARFPNDSVPASTALYLAADLLADRGADDSARITFLAAAKRYPTTLWGRRAAIQAAMIALATGDHRSAAAELDAIAGRDKGFATAASYWAGRARDALGDTAGARARWRAIAVPGQDPYYATLAARKLGIELPEIPGAPIAASRDLPAPLARARRLLALGMEVEARFELESLTPPASASPEALIAAARDLAAGGWYARAARLAQRAADRGAPLDRPLAELLYPLPYRGTLEAEAAEAKLDPLLVAALIRQESLFDPAARSVADARGLMQVLPSLGGQLARRAGIGEFDPVLLYQPDVNLGMGIEHLAQAIGRLEWPERALAAYNAGADPVARWRGRAGADDPELFVERIPYLETRDYVKKVLGNRVVYRSLYRADPVP